MFDVFISDLGLDACDEVMFRLVQRDWQTDELSLMRSKWFDYRFLHPVIATYTYAQAFETIYHRMVRTHLGGSVRRVFKTYDLLRMDKATACGLWRGRQCADALGMPYEVYLDQAFTLRLAYWKQGNLPRPTQLYADMILDAMPERWAELQAGKLFYGAHQELRTHRFVGTSPQLDHHEWLFTQAGKRSNPAAIMRRFYDEDLIPAEKVVARLGAAAETHFASPAL